MQVKRHGVWLVLAAVLLSACASSEPRLLKIGAANDGPDEFAILPGKPLQTPGNFTDLPTPTPGGSNITDQAPNADAIAALGGNPAVLTRAGIPASDSALLTHAGRFGVSTNVRAELAQADLTFRQRRARLSFLRGFSGNRYFAAYQAQSLDQYLELERLRAAGVRTPTAPPSTGR